MLVKIPLGSRFYAQSTVAEVDRVEVVEKDRVLAHGLLQLDRQILLLQFSLDPLYAGLVGPGCKDVVLDQLLRDRTCAFREIAGCDADHRGS